MHADCLASGDQDAPLKSSSASMEATPCSFTIGDKVAWTTSNVAVPRGEIGTVVGFANDAIQVKFSKVTWFFSPDQLQAIAETATTAADSVTMGASSSETPPPSVHSLSVTPAGASLQLVRALQSANELHDDQMGQCSIAENEISRRPWLLTPVLNQQRPSSAEGARRHGSPAPAFGPRRLTPTSPSHSSSKSPFTSTAPALQNSSMPQDTQQRVGAPPLAAHRRPCSATSSRHAPRRSQGSARSNVREAASSRWSASGARSAESNSHVEAVEDPSANADYLQERHDRQDYEQDGPIVEQQQGGCKTRVPEQQESTQANAEEVRQMRQARVREWLLRKEEELAARRKALREQAILQQEQERLQDQRREKRSEEFRRLQEQRFRSAECRRREFQLESGLEFEIENMKQRFNAQLCRNEIDRERIATVGGHKDCQVLLGRAIATYAKAAARTARPRPKSARAGRS